MANQDLLPSWRDMYKKNKDNAVHSRKRSNYISNFKEYGNSAATDQFVILKDKTNDTDLEKVLKIDNQSFIDEINKDAKTFSTPIKNGHNYSYAEAFAGHLQNTKYETEDYDYFNDKIKENVTDGDVQELITNLINNSENKAANNTLTKGKNFEDNVGVGLTDDGSDIYTDLKAYFKAKDGTDLDKMGIYKQVYLCYENTGDTKNCKYFIADFVFVKKIPNPDDPEKFTYELIIADTKLSKVTKFTKNQEEAMKYSAYKIKSLNDENNHLAGNNFLKDDSSRKNNLSRVSGYKFIKIYSNGTSIQYQLGNYTENY